MTFLRSIVLLSVQPFLIAAAASPQLSPQKDGLSPNATLEQIVQVEAPSSLSAFDRTQRLVAWINTSFEWTSTDY